MKKVFWIIVAALWGHEALGHGPQNLRCEIAVTPISHRDAQWKIVPTLSLRTNRIEIQRPRAHPLVLDERAQEMRELLQTKLAPRVALYPLSGDDAPFLFDVFPSLEAVIAIDDHPFVANSEILDKVLIRQPSFHVGYYELDRAGGLASSLFGGIFARFPRVAQITAENTQFSGSHGWVRFEHEGRMRTLYQINRTISPEGVSELWTMIQNMGLSVDLVFVRAAMNQFREQAFARAFVVRQLASGGTLIEGPSGHRLDPEGFEFFGKELPVGMNGEVIKLKNSFGYSHYLDGKPGSSRIRIVKKK